MNIQTGALVEEILKTKHRHEGKGREPRVQRAVPEEEPRGAASFFKGSHGTLSQGEWITLLGEIKTSSLTNCLLLGCV